VGIQGERLAQFEPAASVGDWASDSTASRDPPQLCQVVILARYFSTFAPA
jgi:hypothetical protein